MVYSIILFLCILLFVGVHELLRRIAIRHIKESDNADESCYYRKKFSRLRLISAIIFGCIALYVILSGDNTGVNSVMVGLLLAWTSYINKHTLPLSGKRPHDITKSKFILYLRGFAYDDYSLTQKELSKSHKDLRAFSEGYFINILKQYMSVYAVGMTKELNSPIGAERIYLNDAEWEQEVLDLMTKASLIVILLNDSQSCIWEVEQSLDMLQKTIFIVDDIEKYTNVSTKMKHLIDFPKITNEDLLNIMHFINYSKCDVESFSHNKSSYEKIIKTILHKFLELSNQMPFKNTKVGRFCVKSLLLVAVLLLSALSVGVFAYLTEFDGVVYATSLFLLFILYSITAIKFYKRYIRSDCFNQELWNICKSINQK